MSMDTFDDGETQTDRRDVAELADGIEAFDDLLTDIYDAVPRIPPPAHVKVKLLQSLLPKPQPPQGFQVQYQTDIIWRATGQQGVQYCDFHNDPQTQRVTRLLKMEPGAKLQSHHHDTSEEFYIISGDLRCGDIRLAAGDYQYAEAGTHHAELITDTGCVCLILTM
jgi:anti-sigma factor ChrR (cupin superfamily)